MNGNLALVNNHVWYERPSEEGVRQLVLYPAPTEVLALQLEYVFRPTPLSDPADVPTEIPEEFHSHPIYYVAAVYYRTDEDNPELGQVNEQIFDLKVSELVRYDRQRRAGNGIWRIGISGVTA